MTLDTVAELTRVDWWIAQTLLADAQIFLATEGRVYSDMAPQGSEVPAITFAWLGGADRRQGPIRLTNSLYLIRAITTGSSFMALETLADRIDQVMTLPEGGTIIRDVLLESCLREQPHKRKDQEDGVPHVFLGGIYRIRFRSQFQ